MHIVQLAWSLYSFFVYVFFCHRLVSIIASGFYSDEIFSLAFDKRLNTDQPLLHSCHSKRIERTSNERAALFFFNATLPSSVTCCFERFISFWISLNEKKFKLKIRTKAQPLRSGYFSIYHLLLLLRKLNTSLVARVHQRNRMFFRHSSLCYSFCFSFRRKKRSLITIHKLTSRNNFKINQTKKKQRQKKFNWTNQTIFFIKQQTQKTSHNSAQEWIWLGDFFYLLLEWLLLRSYNTIVTKRLRRMIRIWNFVGNITFEAKSRFMLVLKFSIRFVIKFMVSGT